MNSHHDIVFLADDALGRALLAHRNILLDDKGYVLRSAGNLKEIVVSTSEGKKHIGIEAFHYILTKGLSNNKK